MKVAKDDLVPTDHNLREECSDLEQLEGGMRSTLSTSGEGRAIAALGPVSLLFVIAGATSWQRLTDMSDDDVDWLFR